MNLLFGKQAIGLLLLWFTAGTDGVAQKSVSKANKRPYSLELTSKFHTAGHSLYIGIYFNHHPNMEMNVTYKNRQLGAFVSKYVDFEDIHSRINYATVGLFKSFQLSESVKLTPYVGYSFVQANTLMDKSSDLWSAMVIRFAINESLWVENTTLAGNLLHHGGTVSLANRLNAAMLMGKLRLDIYTWYTHSLHNGPHFASASLGVTSPAWVLTPSVSLKVQVSVLQQITEEKPSGSFDRGILISLIIPVDWSRK